MPRKRLTGKLIFIGLFLLAALGLGWALMPAYSLVMAYPETGKPLLVLPLREGESFSIRYMHSVDISPVFEQFSLNHEGRLQLDETHFKMFGAGMGDWKGHGKLVGEKGWTRITDISEPLEPFILRVGSPGVDHTLLYRGREYNLSAVAAGKRLRVSVEQKPILWQWLRRSGSSLKEAGIQAGEKR